MPGEHAPFLPAENPLSALYSENFTVGGVGPAGQKIIVPAGELWKPVAARGVFTSSATVAERWIHFGITFEATGKLVLTLGAAPGSKASEKWGINVFFGGAGPTSVTTWAAPIGGFNGVITCFAPVMLLRPGMKLYFEALNEQAGDGWGELNLTYEKAVSLT